MVSPYLQQRTRTLDQALEDRVRARARADSRGPVRETPAEPAVDPLDPVGVSARLLLSGRQAQGGDAADDPSPPAGRRAA